MWKPGHNKMPRFHFDQLKILSTHLLASSSLTLPRYRWVVERLAWRRITLLTIFTGFILDGMRLPYKKSNMANSMCKFQEARE